MNLDLEPGQPFEWDWVMTLIIVLFIVALGLSAYTFYIT